MTVKHTYGAPLLCAVAVSLLNAFVGHAAGEGVDDPRVSIEPRGRLAAHSDIRVDASLVLLPVHVTDPKNHLVTGLNAEEFRVYEGKTEQKVLHLSSDDAPLSIGIVFDASGSMASKLSWAREAVAEFLKSANPNDEFFLVNFNNRAELAAPFTHNPEEIHDHLTTANAHGKTALLDAIYLALHYMKKAANSRRALLVISDGGDNDSRLSEGELRSMVQESDVWIYAIGIYARGSHVLPEEERGGPQLLTDIAEQTGGRQVAIVRAAELPEAAAQIGRELRHQYILAYSPSNVEPDGKYHRVQVKLVGRRDLHLSWRTGYYAPGH